MDIYICKYVACRKCITFIFLSKMFHFFCVKSALSDTTATFKDPQYSPSKQSRAALFVPRYSRAAGFTQLPAGPSCHSCITRRWKMLHFKLIVWLLLLHIKTTLLSNLRKC